MADYIRYANQGAIRNKPLNSSLVDAFRFLPDMGLSMEVFSGGQDASGPRRTGSHRHDVLEDGGGAGDVFFMRGDHKLDWANPQDLGTIKEIVARAKAAGVTGFGAGPGYMQPGSMHVGYGTPGVWGAGGRSANAPSWLREAYGMEAPQTMMASAPPSPSAAPPAPTMANVQNKSFDPVGDVVAAAGPQPSIVASAGPQRTVVAGAPGPMTSAAPTSSMAQDFQTAFGDIIAPQAPVSFANIIDSFNRRRQQADEEEKARQSRLAALFYSMQG